MKIYVVQKFASYYYARAISQNKREYSTTLSGAHKYFSKNLAEKTAAKVNGKVRECYYENGRLKFKY